MASPLALAGYRVTGVEISEEMLARARRRRSALDREVAMRLRFSFQDMTCFEFPRRFAASVIVFGSFPLVGDDGARSRCLERIHHHLDPGRLLLVDLPQAGSTRSDAPRRFVSRFLLPSWGHVVDKVFVERQMPGDRVRAIHYGITVSRHADGEIVDTLSVDFDLARLDRAEVDRALYTAGLDVRRVRGDYLGRPWTASSPRMLFEARGL